MTADDDRCGPCHRPEDELVERVLVDLDEAMDALQRATASLRRRPPTEETTDDR